MPANSAPNGQRLQNARVLLIEDGLDDQRLIVTLLTKAGADVTMECHGLAGVDRVQETTAAGETFDVILMDMEMPILDGIAATRRIRELGYQGPIVGVTGHGTPAIFERWTAAGCTTHLGKPFRPRDLLSTVGECLLAGATS